jgi:hypothetical protein
MQWTVRYFLRKKATWEEHGRRAFNGMKYGAAAYAARQSAMWHGMAQSADTKFTASHPMYISPDV